MDRRDWIKTTAAAGAGLALGEPEKTRSKTRPYEKLPDFHPRTIQQQTVPDQTPVMLDSNENPHGPSPRAKTVIEDALAESFRYPGMAYRLLVELIARREGVPPDHVLLGAGSSEILCATGLAYGLHGGEIVTGHPSYRGLTRYARSAGAYINGVPLTSDQTLDLPAIDRYIAASTDLVFVCNPNNPTATVVEDQQLKRFVEEVSSRALVFVDEAYYELIADEKRTSMVDMVRNDHHIVVSRTFSKIFGMAGHRVGYCIARPDIIERIEPYTMAIPNIFGLRAAHASLQDEAFQKSSREKIGQARQYTYDVLDDLGLVYTESQTNFVFFHIGREVSAFKSEMAHHGVLVGRPFPPLTDWCRVSLGTMNEMKTFAAALRTVRT